MSNNLKYGLIAVALLVVGVFGGWYFTATTPMQTHLAGSTVEINPYQYSGGLAWGTDNLLHSEIKVVVNPGSNQANWQNTLGTDVVIDQAEVSINGTASSSYSVYVGTTTAQTVTDQFNLNTAPFWAQLISGYALATSTGAQTGASSALLTDNFTSHKANYPTILQVPPNEYVHVQFNNFCLTSGACETATSTNRGFKNLTVTLWYHYNGF